MEITIGSPGINWIWYLKVDINPVEKTAMILSHYRCHKGENGHPTDVDWKDYSFIEEKDRTVYGLKYDGVDYLVLNPKWIWSYS